MHTRIRTHTYRGIQLRLQLFKHYLRFPLGRWPFGLPRWTHLHIGKYWIDNCFITTWIELRMLCMLRDTKRRDNPRRRYPCGPVAHALIRLHATIDADARRHKDGAKQHTSSMRRFICLRMVGFSFLMLLVIMLSKSCSGACANSHLGFRPLA